MTRQAQIHEHNITAFPTPLKKTAKWSGKCSHEQTKKALLHGENALEEGVPVRRGTFNQPGGRSVRISQEATSAMNMHHLTLQSLHSTHLNPTKQKIKPSLMSTNSLLIKKIKRSSVGILTVDDGGQRCRSPPALLFNDILILDALIYKCEPQNSEIQQYTYGN
ncbi:hypothetical protein YC2023_083096 [Brassica napus]